MQAEKKDYMKDALAARRGKGLEVIIGLGHPDGDAEGDGSGPHAAPLAHDQPEDSKRSDLAPTPEADRSLEAPEASGAGLHAPHPDAVISAQNEMSPGDVPTMDDAKAHFSKNLSEHDIKDMASRKPRSLAERARQHAFMKK